MIKLTPDVLVQAYTQAIFPMSINGEIAWFSPDPRCIIEMDNFHASHSLMRTYRQGAFSFKVNTQFSEVIKACAETARKGQQSQDNGNTSENTWISQDIITAYGELHALGLAHSVESYLDGKLSGGLYGVALGGAFFGESMFHWQTDASKVAMVFLVERLKERGFTLLDCQYHTKHLEKFGASMISKGEYERRLSLALQQDCNFA